MSSCKLELINILREISRGEPSLQKVIAASDLAEKLDGELAEIAFEELTHLSGALNNPRLYVGSSAHEQYVTSLLRELSVIADSLECGRTKKDTEKMLKRI